MGPLTKLSMHNGIKFFDPIVHRILLNEVMFFSHNFLGVTIQGGERLCLTPLGEL